MEITEYGRAFVKTHEFMSVLGNALMDEYGKGIHPDQAIVQVYGTTAACLCVDKNNRWQGKGQEIEEFIKRNEALVSDITHKTIAAFFEGFEKKGIRFLARPLNGNSGLRRGTPTEKDIQASDMANQLQKSNFMYKHDLIGGVVAAVVLTEFAIPSEETKKTQEEIQQMLERIDTLFEGKSNVVLIGTLWAALHNIATEIENHRLEDEAATKAATQTA